jgi:hypothetical protein
MNYKIPEFSGDWGDFSEEAFRQLVNRAHRENQAAYRSAIKLHRELVKIAASLYGSKSRQLAYLRREDPEAPPDLVKKAWKPTIRKYEKWLEAEEKRAKGRDYRKRVKQSNELLQEHGYQPRQHYKPSSAISFANEVIVYDEAGNPLPIRGLPEGKVQTD